MSARGPVPRPEPSWAIFLDLDGTLVEFATAPDGIAIDPTLPEAIARIAGLSGGAVALITGRSIADIDRFFPHLRLPVAGQHGLERRSATGTLSRPTHPPDPLDLARRRLTAAIARHPDLLLEDKTLSLALHYRRNPRLAGFAHRLARAEARELGPEFGLRRGKRVVEIGPAGRNKGEAIRAFLAEPPFAGRLPVFLGDDVTDEAGFRVVNALHGHTIKVGPGPTVARWRLPDVDAARAWLRSADAPDRRPG